MNHHERRRHARFGRRGNINLSIKIKRRSLFFGVLRKPQTATWMDFNRYGMAFESAVRHPPGQKVLLNLSIGQEQLANVVGIVRNTGRSSSGYYRHGISFDFEANNHMRSAAVVRALASIEDTLSHLLVQRI